MKKDKVSTKLVNLTHDLTAFSDEGDLQLDSIRRVIGYNLMRNRQDISSVNLQPEVLQPEVNKEKVVEFGKYAVSSLAEPDKLMFRKNGGKKNVPVVGLNSAEIRTPFNPIDTSAEWRWNQKASERIGPFLNQKGIPLWFDLYYFEDKLSVRTQNGNVPYFLFSKAKRNSWLPFFKNGLPVELKSGYVWLLGKLFSSQAGSNDYFGFEITGGSFTIKNSKKWTGQFLDFKGEFSGTLSLKLVQPDKNDLDKGGCSAAQKIDFKYPDEVVFEWENGNLIKVSGGSGTFSGYGNELKFGSFNLPVSYNAALNHAFIPCTTKTRTWKADFSESQLFEASGEAKILSCFWALPIVRVSNPDTLGDPENNGGWALRLSADLTARWIGSDALQPDAVPNNALILLYPKSLFFYSDKTKINAIATPNINQAFACWNISPENPPRVPLHLNYKHEFILGYYCHASDGETLMAQCNGKMQPDRPVFAEGSLLKLNDLTGWVAFQAKGNDIKIITLLQDPNALKKQPRPLSLENALLVVSDAFQLYMSGKLNNKNRNSHNSIEAGSLTLMHGLLRWKPILPDPYVSNLKEGWDNKESKGNYNSLVYANVSWKKPDEPLVSYVSDLPIIAGVGIKPATTPIIRPLSVQVDDKIKKDIRKNAIDDSKKGQKRILDNSVNNFDRQLNGWKLLDVSTNMDLIGVSVTPNLPGRDRPYFLNEVSRSNQPNQNYFDVKDLAVRTPLNMVQMFTLPQIQWEPVRTLPEDANIAAMGWFPENLSSASDGGPTRLIGVSHELSPIIPDVVVRNIKEQFANGKPAFALTTLSFGLKALLKLAPSNTFNRNADSINLVQPEFSEKKLKGGIQVNLMAESGTPKKESPSPGFEGFMLQTLNGYELFTGTELGLSVLGATLQSDASVETQFNKEFAPGGSNPFVPVSRFDLSGYGGSNFSEWENAAALGSIGKVQFKIIVGRTAFEVVKFVSKIYPWGTTVTRSVTIERRSGGGVIRKDSGWQATQSGIFNFISPPTIPNNPYEFRPGIFKGCFDIKNIRPASNDIVKFSDPDNGNDIEMAPVYFDANVQLDGQINSDALSQGVLGFIQLEPKPDASWLPRLLSKNALKKLIHDQGAIGGPIDEMLNIGNSGFKFRATRFEVDVTDNAGIPNFAGIVRGQPVLPNNGSWSVVKMAAPGNVSDPQEATSADVSRGTPLFIENTWQPSSGIYMNVSGPAGPYRFADPVDLFAIQPRFDYGFMQNTGSQAFLFRRPVIVSGTNEISSSLKPAFADPFALFTTKGVFPPIANSIEFPTSNYKLIVQNGTGKLRLNQSINLDNPRGPLVMVQDGVDQIAIEYDQSNLRVNLNFDDWNVEFDNFFIWTSLLGISKFSGTRFSLRAGNARQAKLINVQSLLKPEIQDTLNFLPGMGSPSDIGDIDLGMTNAKHEIKVHTGFQTPNLIPDPLGKKVKLKLKGSAGVDSTYDTTMPAVGWSAFFGAKFGAELQGKIPVGGIFFVVLGLELGAALRSLASPTSPSGTGSTSSSVTPISFKSLEISAYVGIGMGGDIGPFKAEAFLAAGLVFVYEDNTPKFGGLVKLEAGVDLKIVSVEISAELKGVYYKGDDPSTAIVETNVSLIDASGEVAINISIFFIININASYEYQTTIKP